MTPPPRLAGVIGDPISHSRSPALHGHWLARYGIRGHYVPMTVAAADLEAALRALPKLGFAGINVTLPHKEAVLALADAATERAARIGAANTLEFRAGAVHADNTDGYGFLANMRQSAPAGVPTQARPSLSAPAARRGPWSTRWSRRGLRSCASPTGRARAPRRSPRRTEDRPRSSTGPRRAGRWPMPRRS
jgi:hypothetical protein